MTVSETAQTTDWILQPVNISIKNFNKHTGKDKVAMSQLQIYYSGSSQSRGKGGKKSKSKVDI